MLSSDLKTEENFIFDAHAQKSIESFTECDILDFNSLSQGDIWFNNSLEKDFQDSLLKFKEPSNNIPFKQVRRSRIPQRVNPKLKTGGIFNLDGNLQEPAERFTERDILG